MSIHFSPQQGRIKDGVDGQAGRAAINIEQPRTHKTRVTTPIEAKQQKKES